MSLQQEPRLHTIFSNTLALSGAYVNVPVDSFISNGHDNTEEISAKISAKLKPASWFRLQFKFIALTAQLNTHKKLIGTATQKSDKQCLRRYTFPMSQTALHVGQTARPEAKRHVTNYGYIKPSMYVCRVKHRVLDCNECGR